MKNDLSLLRPFDLEAAKRGEPICHNHGDPAALIKYLAGPDVAGRIAYESIVDNRLYVASSASFRMSPVAWIEGRPVYKGDVLYTKDKERIEITGGNQKTIESTPGTVMRCRKWGPEYLTWTPPKVKREGWVNVLADGRLAGLLVHQTKERADQSAEFTGRIACVRIEWEEAAC